MNDELIDKLWSEFYESKSSEVTIKTDELKFLLERNRELTGFIGEVVNLGKAAVELLGLSLEELKPESENEISDDSMLDMIKILEEDFGGKKRKI